jgi:outer membrane protein assembly factor BamE (lipoprotein component of BamABCDE complex)
MNLKKNVVAGVALTLILAGCATSGKINKVSNGMTKPEVIAVLGPPDSTSSQGATEYLSYLLCIDNCALLNPNWRTRRNYFVRLINGRVESFGEKGDFDSTKTPTVRIERNDTIKQDVRVNQSGDMYTELKKLKDSGIITQEEFDARKKIILAK